MLNFNFNYMALNPTKKQESLESPAYRANPLNDPKFKSEQGYNVFDLNNQQIVTPRFGEFTPFTVFETVPGDRHLLRPNSSSILEQIKANVQSKINEYHDYVFVPMRCVFPNNYEKLVPNPTKGDDLPWKALPMIPLLKFFNKVLSDTNRRIEYFHPTELENMSVFYPQLYTSNGNFDPNALLSVIAIASDTHFYEDRWEFQMVMNALSYVGFALSRGQLLDYVGFCPELQRVFTSKSVVLEQKINHFFDVLGSNLTGLVAYKSHDNTFIIDAPYIRSSYLPSDDDRTLSDMRKFLYDAIENGDFLEFVFNIETLLDSGSDLVTSIVDVFDALYSLTRRYDDEPDESDPFVDGASINPLRIAAYQLAVAEYGTNDHVDNVYTSQLWMQNLRAIMFPAVRGTSREPIFDYNGVQYEYDLLTTGAFDQFVDPSDSELQTTLYARELFLINQLFILRRSLRYGDYYSTGRPNLVAVGQLGIPVNNGMVNPIDNIRSLVVQKFINAVNWIGSKFVNYVTSIFGVKPSYTDPHPVYVAHRKIELNRDKTTNTAGDQGFVTTNLYGQSDQNSIDVFIDDFGVIIGMVSYDALPVYTTGIDRNFYNSDRFSMFNPMLQNVGDQEIAVSELTGWTGFTRQPFAYSARYSQYKFAISRAHGAAVNLLPGVFMKYPPLEMFTDGSINESDLKINPNFIRDKPAYFDQFFDQRSGFGPGSYYHFVCSFTSEHNGARKMMYQPPVLQHITLN